MAKINLQFHATQDEIIEVIKNSVTEYGLFLVSSQLFPEFTCELINIEEFDEKVSILKNSRMIFLYNYKPDTSIKNYMNFLETNKEFLLFDISNQDKNTLRESSIGTITYDTETLKIWKNIIGKFKRNLIKGAWIVWHMTGTKRYEKNHYYTISAKRAFEDGIKIVPFSGQYEYMLNDII